MPGILLYTMHKMDGTGTLPHGVCLLVGKTDQELTWIKTGKWIKWHQSKGNNQWSKVENSW